MYGRTDPPQQWSVHAEFTISHPGAGDPENVPQTNTVQDENGVRMSYTWTSNENANVWPNVPQTNPPPESIASNRSTYSDVGRPSSVYQRGNLFFTSTPPQKFHDAAASVGRLGVQDSGYGSDLLSPSSLAGGSLPRRTFPYNRKCRSTCSIVLSTNIQDKTVQDEPSEFDHVHCGRTQSLRCQTPALRCGNKNYHFYGCGDPWCHHSRVGDEVSSLGRISPLSEISEDPQKTKARPVTFPPQTHDRTNRPVIALQKKDASVQTFEMLDKCTSPLIKADSFNKSPTPYVKNAEKIKRKKPNEFSRLPVRSPQSSSSFTPDSLNSLQPSKKLSRSPNFKKLSTPDQIKTKSSGGESSDASKKPRTIHIDVYCTGTEMESNNSSSESSQEGTASTPQTVFESGSLCVTHKRADDSKLPLNLAQKLDANKSNDTLAEKAGSDVDDEASTAYPSKMSSFSTIRDFSSSISSVPNSWAAYSLSSCTIPDDYDSVANTSWKDTFSDFDSLMHSTSSLAQTESLDFVPKKFYGTNLSIDETPEIESKHVVNTPSIASLQPSDSFEYANSEDKVRINKMEEMWKTRSQVKPRRSPLVERRLLLQQRKMQEYIKKKLSQSSKSKDSDSDVSDDSEKGWTFVKDNENKLERESTIRKAAKDVPSVGNKPAQLQVQTNLGTTARLPKAQEEVDQGSLSDSSPSIKPSKSAVLLQRLKFDPTLRSPFAILPGQYTEQRYIAARFGPVVDIFRKPGHHIGPVKNPDCLCEHCQRHFENLRYRNRTNSVGDPPGYQVQNWKDFVMPLSDKKEIKSGAYTDL